MLILKIIGITLLSIVGTLVFLILTVLFIPIRYGVTVKKDKDVFFIDADTTWFLSFFGFKIRFKDKKLTKIIRIGFLKWYNDGSTAKKSGQEEKEKLKDKSNKKGKVESGEKSGISLFKRLKNLFKNRVYCKRVFYKEKDVILKALYKTKKLIIHILPHDMKGKLYFGFDDPSLTGKILGFIAIIYSRFGEVLEIKPDFENKVFECDLKIKGKVFICEIVALFLFLWFNKELKRTFKALKKLSAGHVEEK